jgi:predicted peptidase
MPLLIFALFVWLAQSATSHVLQQTFQAPDGSTILYGISIPRDYDPGHPRPLVLALHPGGTKTSYYGVQYMTRIFLPGLRELDPIMLAPDCPTAAWSDPAAEQAVMALINKIRGEYAIDRRRIVVVGFSLGGRGTWFMSARHPDLFTAAIVMAGATDEPVERLGKIPTYVIHSRADERVPFAQAKERATELEELHRVVKFEAIDGAGHFDMTSYLPALQRAERWVSEHWPH